MQDPTRLFIWQRAIRLSAAVGRAIPPSASRKAPGLRAQIMRAADGIALAIAEGCGKSSDWELARYADIGGGSVTELQTQLVLAYKHGILSGALLRVFWRECVELRKMIHSFVKKVQERARQKDEEAARQRRSRRANGKREELLDPRAPPDKPPSGGHKPDP